MKISSTPTLKPILFKPLIFNDPADITYKPSNSFNHTSEPLNSKASATRPTATMNAAVRKSTECFFETL